MTAGKVPTLVDELAAAAMDAREALREVRSELREARRVITDLQAERAETEAMIRRTVDDELGQLVTEQLAEFNASVRKAMDTATDKVVREFDGLRNILMTGNRRGRTAAGLDIAGVIRRGGT